MRVEQLGIPPGDAVEGARVELDAVPGLVHLRAHAVVLVLDDVRRRKALRHLREVEHRRREHHPDRAEMRERRLVERAVFRAQRRLADVAGEHVRAGDRLALTLERVRDGVHEQSFAQTDARLAGDDLHDVARLAGVRATQQRAHQLALVVRAADRGDAVERRRDIRERQRVAFARRVADEVVRDVAEIGVPLVARAHVVAALAPSVPGARPRARSSRRRARARPCAGTARPRTAGRR